jgi:HEAT repeat protein
MIRLLVTVLVLWPRTASGVGTIPNSPVQQDTSSERYINDLDSADPNLRIFAARVLLRRTKEAARIGNRESTELRVLEARALMSAFDVKLAPRCTRLLTTKNVARACAQILGLLETQEAIGPLKALIAHEPSRRVRRSATHAIDRIQAAQ